MSRSQIELESLIQYLDALLDIPEFPDYPGAMNGLQVEGSRPIRRVGAAVDASLASVHAAVEGKVDLLLVHHGLYWNGARPLTGRLYRRVAPLVQGGVALYSAHLPLDAHPDVGNCAVLTRALGLEPAGRFGSYGDEEIGFRVETDEDREAFRDRVAEASGGGPVRLIEGGPERVKRVGIVTGGGGGFVADAAEAGLDTLLTGEGSHHTYLDAMELGINLLYAGHYATEVWGVRALAGHLQEEFGLPWEFFDFPTGM